MQFESPRRLAGLLAVPGDKSISHRALLLAALADGQSVLVGVSPGHDVAATAACLRALGVALQCVNPVRGLWHVHGTAIDRWRPPAAPLDCGNSGTTMRLLCGLLSSAPALDTTLVGDASLSRRPMRRVAEPLRQLGAQVRTSPTGTAPIAIAGGRLSGGTVRLAVASAQVKSALLLAGLHADGEVAVHEPLPTRDHTERMLLAMGARLRLLPDGAAVAPGPLVPLPEATIAGDPSAAAFAMALAVLHRDAEIGVTGVCLNPRRTGWLRVLTRMDARLASAADEAAEQLAGEPTGTVVGRSSQLQATDVQQNEVPDCVDEIPILALCMAGARGVSTLRGLGELRVKESDRLAATAALLTGLGVAVEMGSDWLRIAGVGSPRNWQRLATFDPGLDHRMALCAAVAGLCGKGTDGIRNWPTTATSWPGFAQAVDALTREPAI